MAQVIKYPLVDGGGVLRGVTPSSPPPPSGDVNLSTLTHVLAVTTEQRHQGEVCGERRVIYRWLRTVVVVVFVGKIYGGGSETCQTGMSDLISSGQIE